MQQRSYKFWRTVIVSLIFLTVSTMTLFGQELLQNPGFEQGKKSWHLDKTDTIDTNNQHSGKAAIKVTGDGEWKMFQQTIKAEAAKSFTFSFWAKLDDCDKDVTVLIQYLDNKWLALATKQVAKLSGTVAYKQYTFTGTTPPKTAKIRIRLNSNGSDSGAVFFDDLSISYNDKVNNSKIIKTSPKQVTSPTKKIKPTTGVVKSEQRGSINIESSRCKGIYLSKSNPTNQPYDEKAAKVIQEYLLKASGITLPIKYLNRSKPNVSSGMILVGQLAVKSGVIDKSDVKKLTAGGYIIEAKDGLVAVASPGLDGIIAGAYNLIEQALNVDFVASSSRFTVTEPPIKAGTNIEIKPMKISSSPAMAFRFARNVAALGYSDFMLLGDAKLINGKYDNTCHTANGFINYEKYKDSHPEYFAMLADGKRMHKTANMRRFDVHYCVSNPAVVKIVTKSLIKWMKADSKAKYFWVTPGDGRNRHCHCKKCLAQDIKPGVVSDRWLKFVNKIAKVAAKECPEQKIITLAYVDLEAPPIKTRPAKNVIAMYCPYPMNWSNHLAAFDDPDSNSAGIKTLKGWVDIAQKNVGIFSYPSSCAEPLAIWPSFYANYEKIKYYTDNKLTGIELCGLFPYGSGYPGHNSFNTLQLYVLSNVLWNPKLAVEQEINHFIKLYYGPGAAAMREFWDLIHEQVKVDGRHFAQHTEETKRGFVTEKFAKQAYAIFAKAEKATKGTRFYQRIEKEKMHLLYADLTDRCLSNAKISPSNIVEYAEKIGEFLRITKKLKITTFSRKKTIDWFWDTMLLKVKSPTLYNDPVVLALMNDPVKTLQSAIKSHQKVIPGGWNLDSSCLGGGRSYRMANKSGKKVPVKILRRPTSGFGTVMAIFELKSIPKGAYLLINGRGHKGNETGEVILNGKKIYSSKDIFKQTWGKIKVKIPANLLHSGVNQIIINNTTADIIGKDSAKGVDYIRAQKRNYYWGWFAVANINVIVKKIK